MSYDVYPVTDDQITQDAETRSRARGNSSDYVERGMSVTLNGDGTFDVGSGFAVVRDGTDAWEVEDETGTSGVQLATTSGDNWVFLTFDDNAGSPSDVNTSVTYDARSSNSPPSNPSLLIAVANESTSTVTEKNRDPSISAEEGRIKTVDNENGQELYAGHYSGSDEDTRLDNALAAASGGDTVYLEVVDGYAANRTGSDSIDKGITISGFNKQTTRINGTWEMTGRGTVTNLRVDGQLTLQNEIDVNTIRLPGDIVVENDSCVLSNIQSVGSITFASGTSDGSVGVVDGRISVTDNGSNRVI